MTDPTRVDLVVVGSGAGALMGAVRAADAGLSVLVVEKSALVGGTSAISGGGIWVPCNDDQARAGVADRIEDAFLYLRTCARGLASDDRVLAYLETARAMAAYLAEIGVPYRCMPLYADYYPTLPGARPGGRTMDPLAFDAARLGLDALGRLRPTNPGQLIFGRMNIDAFDARTMLAKERGANWVLAKIMLRYFLDYPWRRRTRRDRRLTGGQALVGGLYAALLKRKVPIWLESPLRELVREGEGGRVTGIVVEHEGKPVTVQARLGVLLAAGGFERDPALRAEHLPQPTDAAWTATPPGCNTGDAIRAGAAAGAALHLMAHTWGAPTLDVPKEDKFRALFVERSLPGCMVVNARGARFLNESCPYPEFQQAMYADHAQGGGAIPAWIVFDAGFRARYPIGPLMPASAVPDAKVRRSWWNKVVWKGATLDELAAAIGVDAAGLRASAARMSDYARSGKDLEFDRGGNVFDRYYGDVNVKPNPNLAPIERGPFYAMKLWPGDIGTKGGLVTDRDARVLDTAGRVIEGLYCVGNNSASVMGPSYAGAGSTLGPAMTFAFRAVAAMRGQALALQRTDLLQAPG
ncbi:MAG: FAD-binding protein [Burkholderiales bacterium]|nr:FAD-binding protein [Burkholderiales bacterium]MDE1926062.1 FAD-binding protein [Burkholderiales bacterium]MDE2159549.1 FAD-binding protein [Burkholderiales bacterium]MDE2502072.1 FAD-binding protein [Burkholderiales bacterium]